MATTYLQLVNDINARVNEVQLTSSNFASSNGHYQVAKQSINDAIRRISVQAFEWPFFHVTYSETLVAGQVRYPYQSNCKTVDYDSFRVTNDGTLATDTTYLKQITYEDYLKFHSDNEYNSSTGIRKQPTSVFEAQDQEYGLIDVTDKAYVVDYEYFKYPTDLSAHDDTMEFPDAFRHLIVDMAMFFLYQFRSDYENADRVMGLALEGVKDMRTIYVNRYEYVSDTRVHRNTYQTTLRVS